jgi:nucleoside-diphosphate-sugar epimerase
VSERFFITGGQGFLGAWIAKHLLVENARCTLFDLAPDDRILEQVLEPEETASLEREYGDVADTRTVVEAVEKAGATRLIHLAGVQIPTCRADPLLGARVNVIGTLNALEAARLSRGRVRSVTYASSAAVAGAVGDYTGPIPDGAQHVPRTHYGVFKTANEGNARVYWLDHGLPSVGLRPLAVYGVGREVGVTSGPTKAIKSAVLERRYTIPFSGPTAFNYVEDAARVFVACSRLDARGAHALNMRGEKLSVEEFAAVIEREVPEARGRVRVEGPPIPVAFDFGEPGLERLLGSVHHTPVEEGVRRTADRFRALLSRGKLHDRDLAS